MIVLGYLALFLAIDLVVAFFFQERPAVVSILGSNFFEKDSAKKKKRRNFLDKIGQANLSFFGKTKFYIRYQKQIEAAGISLQPHGFIALKQITALASFFFFFLLALQPEFILVAVLVGFFLPDFFLAKKIKDKKNEILRILPEFVDLISLCISAGLDFMGAIRWVTESRVTFGGAVVEEFSRVREEINLGKPRRQALTDLRDRLELPEISSLVRSLLLAERLGVSIGEGLKNFSQDNRKMRFYAGERKARMAAIKVLFPLVFCILPVIGIIVVGPVILQFMEQGIGGAF